jgi:hypothetical protein
MKNKNRILFGKGILTLTDRRKNGGEDLPGNLAAVTTVVVRVCGSSWDRKKRTESISERSPNPNPKESGKQ